MILGNLNKLLFFRLIGEIFVGKSGEGVNFSSCFLAQSFFEQLDVLSY
jgi:hypothetical protein